MMCYCTPSIRTPFCHNCNQYMRTEIESLRQQLANEKACHEACEHWQSCQECHPTAHAAPTPPTNTDSEPVALDYWHQKDCEYLEQRTNTDELHEAARAVVENWDKADDVSEMVEVLERLRKVLKK